MECNNLGKKVVFNVEYWDLRSLGSIFLKDIKSSISNISVSDSKVVYLYLIVKQFSKTFQLDHKNI